MLLRTSSAMSLWALPASLALVLGVLWMRRKRGDEEDDDRSSGSGDTDSYSEGNSPIKNSPSQQHMRSNGNTMTHSDSMPIGCLAASAGVNGHGTNISSATKAGNNHSPTQTSPPLGKSAPIDIQPNRITPVKLTNQQIDRDILKVPTAAAAAAAESDDDTFSTCNSESPSALSDSGERRRRYSFGQRKRTVQEGNPIVVKATQPAKISPPHSFAEAKYEATVRPDCEPKTAAEAPPAVKTVAPVINESATQVETQAIKSTKGATPSSSLGSEPISNDSGQCSGSPLTYSEDSQSLVAAVEPPKVLRHYDFLIVQDLIGTLLGRKGAFVKEIRRCCGTNVIIKKHPLTSVVRIASLEGSSAQIDVALRMIRKKFPLKRHPGLSLQQVSVEDLNRLNHSSQQLQLDLIEDINNDVTVSAVVTGGHIFVQQPVHPSFPGLTVLQRYMKRSYDAADNAAPSMPASVAGRDAVCAAHFNRQWFRVQIGFESEDACVVKFLDFGGYASVARTDLRQIRADFMTVPFQATECVLANVRPLRGVAAREWQQGAVEALQRLTDGRILQAQVVGYTVDGLASVHLYSQLSPSHIVFINHELAARGLVRWVDNDDDDDFEETEPVSEVHEVADGQQVELDLQQQALEPVSSA